MTKRTQRWWEMFLMDQDFDDDTFDLLFLKERIAEGKPIALTPDGDRRNSKDDPVPLHSHVPNCYDRMGAEFFIQKKQNYVARPKPKPPPTPWWIRNPEKLIKEEN